MLQRELRRWDYGRLFKRSGRVDDYGDRDGLLMFMLFHFAVRRFWFVDFGIE